MAEIKKQQPTNPVASQNSDYYTKPRKVTNPKIVELAEQLNFKSAIHSTASRDQVPKQSKPKAMQQQKSSRSTAASQAKAHNDSHVKSTNSSIHKKATNPQKNYDGYDWFERDCEYKELKEYKVKLIIATIAYILAIIFFGRIPASSVPDIVLTLFNIAFIVITIILVGAHVGYQLRKREFKNNFPE